MGAFPLVSFFFRSRSWKFAFVSSFYIFCFEHYLPRFASMNEICGACLFHWIQRGSILNVHRAGVFWSPQRTGTKLVVTALLTYSAPLCQTATQPHRGGMLRGLWTASVDLATLIYSDEKAPSNRGFFKGERRRHNTLATTVKRNGVKRRRPREASSTGFQLNSWAMASGRRIETYEI